jgi:hypothetical protein
MLTPVLSANETPAADAIAARRVVANDAMTAEATPCFHTGRRSAAGAGALGVVRVGIRVVVDMSSSVSSAGCPMRPAHAFSTNGRVRIRQGHRKMFLRTGVAGCRIGAMPFVVGVRRGHRDRPGLRRTDMTHYLLAVHGPAEMDEFGNYGSKEEMEEAFAATGAFNDKLHADGYWVFAGGLQSASTATVVDGQGETPVMTDGPYLETKEVIGGFWVIDAPDLDVALKLAAEGSKACRGKVEVRPFDGLA